jgi:hypothetical protein
VPGRWAARREDRPVFESAASIAPCGGGAICGTVAPTRRLATCAWAIAGMPPWGDRREKFRLTQPSAASATAPVIDQESDALRRVGNRRHLNSAWHAMRCLERRGVGERWHKPFSG